MLKKAADDIGIAFDLLLETLTAGQAAVRKTCAKASLDSPARQVSNYAATLEKMPLWVKQLEAQRSVILEGLCDQSEAPTAGVDAPAGSGMSMEMLQAPGTSTLTMTYNGVRATGVESGADFTVRAGSTVKQKAWPSLSKRLAQLRARSERDGTLIPTADPDLLELTRDVRFTSKSAAATFVGGCSLRARS